MLEDYGFTAGNRDEDFLLSCNLCDKLATVSCDFWAGYLGNDLSELPLFLISASELKRGENLTNNTSAR